MLSIIVTLLVNTIVAELFKYVRDKSKLQYLNFDGHTDHIYIIFVIDFSGFYKFLWFSRRIFLLLFGFKGSVAWPCFISDDCVCLDWKSLQIIELIN